MGGGGNEQVFKTVLSLFVIALLSLRALTVSCHLHRAFDLDFPRDLVQRQDSMSV